jgi:hypothetical protein
MIKYTGLIKEMRYQSKIIQRNYKIYILRKHAIETRLDEFFREESQYLQKLNFDNSKYLFPNINISNNLELTEFFGDELDRNISEHNEFLIPEFDPYGEPKITVFAKILDIDIIVNMIIKLDGFQ